MVHSKIKWTCGMYHGLEQKARLDTQNAGHCPTLMQCKSG
jgi:hypothetical protein